MNERQAARTEACRVQVKTYSDVKEYERDGRMVTADGYKIEGQSSTQVGVRMGSTGGQGGGVPAVAAMRPSRKVDKIIMTRGCCRTDGLRSELLGLRDAGTPLCWGHHAQEGGQENRGPRDYSLTQHAGVERKTTMDPLTIVGFVAEKLWATREENAKQRSAARRASRGTRDEYRCAVYRISDRIEFALRQIGTTKQRLLAMPLEQAAEHVEELRERWRDLKRAIEAGLALLEEARVPAEWMGMDTEIRQGLMTAAVGVDIFLSAKSQSDASRGNHTMDEGMERMAKAVVRQAHRRS